MTRFFLKKKGKHSFFHPQRMKVADARYTQINLNYQFIPRLLTPSKPPVFVDPNHCVPKVWLDPMLGALRSQQAGHAWPKRPATSQRKSSCHNYIPPQEKQENSAKTCKKQKQLELVCVCVCVLLKRIYPTRSPANLDIFSAEVMKQKLFQTSEVGAC